MQDIYKLCALGDSDISVWVHHYNKCATLLGDIDNAGDYAFVGPRGRREISGTFARFLCKPETALKH